MIAKYLSSLKEARGYSNQKIAEMSDVSLSTVERILAGKAKNTSFEVLRAITFALQGNMDDLAKAVDSTPGEHPETYGNGPALPTVPEKARELVTAADLNTMLDMFTAMLREKDANYDRHIQAMHRRYADDISILRREHEMSASSVKEEHARAIRRYEQQLARKDIIVYIMVGLLIVFLVAAILYLAKFDIPNGDYGVFRY